jgi:hypothetical protein
MVYCKVVVAYRFVGKQKIKKDVNKVVLTCNSKMVYLIVIIGLVSIVL